MKIIIEIPGLHDILERILHRLEHPHHCHYYRRATQITLGMPQITNSEGNVIMANIELLNDTVATYPILTTDEDGVGVPAPTGDVFTVVSSNPASLGAAIGATAAGGPAVVLTPLVQQSPGLSITVSDSAGLTVFTDGVDIVSDLTPKAIGLDTTNVTTVAQAEPTNPGP
jgi:hypothetical protein